MRMSVLPAHCVSTRGGPPCVSRNTAPKLVKLNANEATINGSEQVVDLSARFLKQALPGDDGERDRDRHRENQQSTVDVRLAHVLVVQQQRDQQTGRVLRERRGGGEDEVPDEGREEHCRVGSGEKVEEILRPDERRVLEIRQAPVGERDGDRQRDGNEREQRHGGERWGEIEVRREATEAARACCAAVRELGEPEACCA